MSKIKKQISLFLLIAIMTSSCVAFKYQNYEASSTELSEKLPKLALEIDTSSIAGIFNQLEYRYGEYIFSPNTILPPSIDFSSRGLGFSTYASLKVIPKCAEEAFRIKRIFFAGDGWENDKELILFHIKYKNSRSGTGNSYSQAFYPSKITCKEYSDSTSMEFYSDHPSFSKKLINRFFINSTDSSRISKLQPLIKHRLNLPFDNNTSMIFGNELISSGLLRDMPIRVVSGNAEYDTRVQDQLAYIKHEVEKKICEEISESKGKIKFEILNSKLTKGNYLFIPSVLTLFTINLLGFPLGSQSVEFSLKCTISDDSNNEIYSKTCSVKGKSYSAMYWGYNMFGAGNILFVWDVHRSANMKAISEAMNLIKKDIQSKKKELQSAFNAIQ
jgi:hypothetical protein